MEILTGRVVRCLHFPLLIPCRYRSLWLGVEVLPRRHSRVRNLPEFAGEFPVATLAEEILIEGAGQVKALLRLQGIPCYQRPWP